MEGCKFFGGIKDDSISIASLTKLFLVNRESKTSITLFVELLKHTI